MGKNNKTRHEAEWQLIKEAVERVIDHFGQWKIKGWECSRPYSPGTGTERRTYRKSPIEVDCSNNGLIAITLTSRDIKENIPVWCENRRRFLPGPWYLALLGEMEAIRVAIEESKIDEEIKRKQLLEDPHLFDDWSVNHD